LRRAAIFHINWRNQLNAMISPCRRPRRQLQAERRRHPTVHRENAAEAQDDTYPDGQASEHQIGYFDTIPRSHCGGFPS
jgi:hypothetical protein